MATNFNHRKIPKGWRMLRFGDKLSYPFKVFREYVYGDEDSWSSGQSDNSSIGKRRDRTWAKVIIPKN